MKIIPETLKHWRKKRGFSQQKLAEEASIDQKTVARIEVGKGGETRRDTVERIAKALRVKPETLGEAPDADARHDEEVRKKYGWGVLNHRLRLDGRDVIAYDLIQDRYGVGMYDLIKVTPLLFTILAEQSLADRSRRLEEMEKNYEDFPGHLLFGADYTEALSAEKRSVDSRDLFGHHMAFNEFWSGTDSYFFEEARNPFNDFLIEQAKSLGPDNDAIDPEEISNYGNFDDLPSYYLFESYRKSLTGGSSRADYALSRGYTRIGQIPKELRGEDESVTAERVEWLESKVPDEDWDEYEKRMRPLREATAKIINKSLSEGGKADA